MPPVRRSQSGRNRDPAIETRLGIRISRFTTTGQSGRNRDRAIETCVLVNDGSLKDQVRAAGIAIQRLKPWSSEPAPRGRSSQSGRNRDPAIETSLLPRETNTPAVRAAGIAIQRLKHEHICPGQGRNVGVSGRNRDRAIETIALATACLPLRGQTGRNRDRAIETGTSRPTKRSRSRCQYGRNRDRAIETVIIRSSLETLGQVEQPAGIVIERFKLDCPGSRTLPV